MKDILRGTGVALITPFKEDFSIDFDAIEKIIKYVTDNGVDYLVVMGTTGETPSLHAHEKKELAAFVREVNGDRLPLVYGLGGNNTAEVCDKLKTTDFQGYQAILSVTPYYNKPQQEGLYRHFMALAEASPLPIILYNVPGRTGVNMLAETTLRLAHSSKKICAIKEASGNLDQMAKILKDKPDEFLLISGDDNLTLHILSMGGAGVISVVANVLPAPFSKMVHLALEGQFAEAANIHLKLFEFTNLLFAGGSPAGAKVAMAHLGLCKDILRLPLVSVTPDLKQKIEQTLQTITL
ncbi:MAG: 4-hydroxy-tetrahydrodipicolinate synthase [Bacteroidales bacterium]|jgi:4-hydroxy-tetrahydrodipicolinate synthase|nr:4-hydroxy-tetrahydrodipicolinate synthase [Bacteroidales bacterium]